MKLDYSAILGNTPLNSPQGPPGGQSKPAQGNTPNGMKKPEQAASLAAQSQQERKELERARQAYSDYQHNIKASEALRAEILKGLAKGESHAVILEKAIRCIGLMTHDKVFAAQAANML